MTRHTTNLWPLWTTVMSLNIVMIGLSVAMARKPLQWPHTTRTDIVLVKDPPAEFTTLTGVGTVTSVGTTGQILTSGGTGDITFATSTISTKQAQAY